MPNEKDLQAFLVENPLPDGEEDYTWWDADRDVAWEVEESYFGKLAAVYQAAGWERCYHRSGNHWHINVKVHGGDWQKRRAFIEEMREKHQLTREDAEDYFERTFEMEIDSFWRSFTDFDYVLSEDRIDTGLKDGDYWQCGRMGGYMNIADSFAAYNPEEMILIAMYAQETVEYMNDSDALYMFMREWIADSVHDDRIAEEQARRAKPMEILQDILKNDQAVRMRYDQDAQVYVVESSNGDSAFRFDGDIAEWGHSDETLAAAIGYLGKAWYE